MPKNNRHEKADTVATAKLPVDKPGTTIKKSRPFQINNLTCYWEQKDTLMEEGTMDVIQLKDHKTHRSLLNHIECCSKYGFDFASPDNFMDVNFDGFHDFLIRSYGSTAENEVTNIYLFDNKAKRFVYSEELSDNGIGTDTVGRKLITSSFGRDFQVTKTHHFDASGKVTYTEVMTEYSKSIEGTEFPVEYKKYEKIVGCEVVETKTDSVIYTEK